MRPTRLTATGLHTELAIITISYLVVMQLGHKLGETTAQMQFVLELPLPVTGVLYDVPSCYHRILTSASGYGNSKASA